MNANRFDGVGRNMHFWEEVLVNRLVYMELLVMWSTGSGSCVTKRLLHYDVVLKD